MSEVVITKDNFATEVLESKIPVLVDFWATWCPPCRMLAPIVAQIAEENAGKIKVGKVNTDEQQELAARFRIEAIPTVLVFKNGQLVNQSVGYVTKDKLLGLI